MACKAMLDSAKPPAGSSSTHSSLFLRLQGDAAPRQIAWYEFNSKYEPIISAFARRMGAPGQDIADIVQEVLLGFFGASPQFVYDRAVGRYRGYLKACTWRVVKAKCRKAISAHFSIDRVDQEELAVEAVWADVWERERLQRAMENVRTRYSKRPDKLRTFQAFELCAVLDLPVEEVARRLDMKVASVHQAKTRISKAIKAAMNDLERDLS